GHAGPGVRARAAEIEPVDRRDVPAEGRDGPHEEDLVEGQLAVGNGALGQAVPPLDVRGREGGPGEDAVREAGKEALDDVAYGIRERIPGRGVPGPAIPPPVRHVLHA